MAVNIGIPTRSNVLSTIFSRDSVKKACRKSTGYNEKYLHAERVDEVIKKGHHNDGSALFTCHVWLE